MSEGKRYIVQTFDDFLQIPFAKLDACLDEFRVALRHMIITDRICEAEGHKRGSVEFGEFIWTDDGDESLRVQIEPKESSDA